MISQFVVDDPVLCLCLCVYAKHKGRASENIYVSKQAPRLFTDSHNNSDESGFVCADKSPIKGREDEMGPPAP